MTMKVLELKTTVFSALNLQDKVNIKNVGRPTPAISITQVQAHCKNRGSFTRRFDICFVCLLFGGYNASDQFRN